MRNLKKILALVLALVMSFSIMTVSSAAFADQDKISESYTEAVDVLTALNVFKGIDGNFAPEKTITRAEVAAIIYRVTTGDVEDERVSIYAGMNLFSDVEGWAAGYINYCAANGYIQGYDGKFFPTAEVTGTQALAMILRAVGYDKNGEFSGNGWEARVNATAAKAKVLGGLSKVNMNAPASREVVAQILFNSINVPQVTYSILTNDYLEYTGLLTDAAVQTNKTLAEETFGLIRIYGQINAVGRLAGTTEIGAWTVTNTATSWELIGHDAHIWAQKTINKPFIATALTEAYIDSVSIATFTQGYSAAMLIAYDIVPADDNYDVFYNGERLPIMGYDEDGNRVVKMSVNDGLALAERGAKIDFICNDNGGKADVITITDYTPASVTAIATDINYGTNAVVYNSYKLDNVTYKANRVVYNGTLEKGGLYTYVNYRGDAYISDVTYTVGDFTKLNRSAVDSITNKKDTNYTVGGEVYYKAYESAHYFAGYPQVLTQANLLEKVVLCLDQYGYVLFSYVYTDPSQFLYVFENEETHKKLTEAVVVFLDGTVETVKVAYVDKKTNNYFDDSTDATNNHNKHISGEVYEYVVNENGEYILYTTDVFVETPAADYTAGKAQYGDLGVNNATSLVDVRSAYAKWYLGNLYVGHRGENRIPSIDDMVTLSVVGANGIVSAGFIVYGWDHADAPNYSNEFIVFNTAANDVERDVYGDYWYYLDVIVDGAIVEDFKLSDYEYSLIDTYGVGHYQIARNGALTYKTFAEDWKEITWGKQTLKIDGKFYAYDELPFMVLNIGDGEAVNYTMTSGFDGREAKAYLTYDAYGEVDAIYVIADIDNLATEEDSAVSLYNTYYNWYGEAYTVLCHYYVADGAITVKADAADVAVMDLVVAVEEAAAEYEAAVAALEAWLEDNAAAKATVTLNDLYAAVEAAAAALNNAMAQLFVVTEQYGELPAALVDVIEVAKEIVAEVEEIAAEVVEAADEYVAETVEDVELNLTIGAVDVVYTVGKDTDVKTVVAAAVEELANKAAAQDATLADVLALGAVVKAEVIEGVEAANGTYNVLVKLTLVLGANEEVYTRQFVTVTVTVK